MENEIIINQKNVPIREYQGQRVITFRDIDTVHERVRGTAKRNFSKNRKYFIEGEDYFVRNSYQAMKEFGVSAPKGLIVITESGYLMLVKSFGDDLAWAVQKQLVNSYFRTRIMQTSPPTAAGSAAASLINATMKGQQLQGSSPRKIATQVERICKQFGIDIIEDYVEPEPYSQLSLLEAAE